MDQDFEARLRSDLARAALTAPELKDLEPVRARRRVAFRWIVPLAAAAAVVAAASVWWVTGTMTPSTDGRASCPSKMRFDGRTYDGYGEPVRIPRPKSDLGTGTHPACEGEDAWESDVSALPGVGPDIAVLSMQQIWVADTVRTLPEELAELQRPVRCHGAGSGNIAGDWVAVNGRMPERDNQLVPPYVAIILADEGGALPLDEYSAVAVKVDVTRQTLGGSSEALEEQALRGPTRVVLEVRCAGGRFVADSITADD